MHRIMFVICVAGLTAPSPRFDPVDLLQF